MARLLEVYDQMLKEAEFAKQAEEVQFMFAKYAETAEGLLTEEYGKDFDTNDVESLARGLMERDSQLIEEAEKVAEYEGIGRQLAHMYFDELKKQAVHVPFDAAGTAGPGASKLKNLYTKVTSAVREQVRKRPITAASVALGAGAVGGAALSGGDK